MPHPVCRACVCVLVCLCVAQSVCVRALGGSFEEKSYIKAHPLTRHCWVVVVLFQRVIKTQDYIVFRGSYRAVGSHHAGWILLRAVSGTPRSFWRWELWPQRSVVVGGGIPVARAGQLDQEEEESGDN